MVSSPLKLVTYLLRHWSQYERDLSYLEDGEKEEATIFFKALMQMEPHEVVALADKYRVDGRPRTDKVLADRSGDSQEVYVDRRLKIQMKLWKFMEIEWRDMETRREREFWQQNDLLPPTETRRFLGV